MPQWYMKTPGYWAVQSKLNEAPGGDLLVVLAPRGLGGMEVDRVRQLTLVRQREVDRVALGDAERRRGTWWLKFIEE